MEAHVQVCVVATKPRLSPLHISSESGILHVYRYIYATTVGDFHTPRGLNRILPVRQHAAHSHYYDQVLLFADSDYSKRDIP
jgi:hypothetical protein